MQAVFWYNLAVSRDRDDAPADAVYRYKWRHPLVIPQSTSSDDASRALFRPGDAVFVKPPHATCTTRWRPGSVTGVISENVVEVAGVPRHVLDLRGAPKSSCEGGGFLTRPCIGSSSTQAEDDGEIFFDAELGETEAIQGHEEEEHPAEVDAPDEPREQQEPLPVDRPVRSRRPPAHLADFVLN